VFGVGGGFVVDVLEEDSLFLFLAVALRDMS
jgi:hypothetical protein